MLENGMKDKNIKSKSNKITAEAIKEKKSQLIETYSERQAEIRIFV
jgi:hypothetical protein